MTKTKHTPKEKELVRWFLDAYEIKTDGSFVLPPRLIKVYSDETCKFFSSKMAADYVREMDILYMEGAQGDLPKFRQEFKRMAEIQKASKKEANKKLKSKK